MWDFNPSNFNQDEVVTKDVQITERKKGSYISHFQKRFLTTKRFELEPK